MQMCASKFKNNFIMNKSLHLETVINTHQITKEKDLLDKRCPQAAKIVVLLLKL